MGKVTQDLKKEHDTILHVLKIMDKLLLSRKRDEEARWKTCGEYLHFLKIFVDKCHHVKEENFLFKELVKYGVPDEGGPVGQMRREHAQSREYIVFISEALEGRDLEKLNKHASLYRDLLVSHMKKETNTIFPEADHSFDADKQDEIFRKFEDYEKNILGEGVHEEMEALVKKWEGEA